MTITRRNFLKWSGIGALGTVVFAGCGIPEEELLVQSPATMPEDMVTGLEAWYATSCAQCNNGEGIIVRIIEGRAIKIEGNPDHPVSKGKTSVRSQAGLQVLYNPDRLTGPMKRTGNRGLGEFEPITWDEALAEVLPKLTGTKSVAMITDPVSGSLGRVIKEFVDRNGTRHMALESMEQTVLTRTVRDMFGQEVMPVFDISNADYVLNFGADFLSTWLSPVQYSRAYGEFRQGHGHRGTLVHIEPRMSMTAANADKWHYVTPGTEGLVALSIAYVLVKDFAQDIDQETLSLMTGGGGVSALASYAPESTVDATGLTPEVIENIAHELTKSEHSLVIGGGAAAAHINGLFNMRAIYSLNLLLGNIGKKGGIRFNPEPADFGIDKRDAVATFQDWKTLRDDLSSGKTDTLLIHGANPAYTLESINFTDGAKNAKTIISFSSFLDESSALADIILPDHTYLESWGDHDPDPGPGYQTVTFQQPVVFPFNQDVGRGTRSFGDVLLDLDSKLGNSPSYSNMKEAVRARATKLYDQNRGSVQSGNFEAFWISVLQRGGWWDEKSSGPNEGPTKPITSAEMAAEYDVPNTTAEYPFHLIPFESNSITDGRGANQPWLQAAPDPLSTATWETWVEINAKKADELGIKEGDEVEIASSTGFINALAYPNPASSPEVLSVPTGLGHKHYGNFEIGPDMFRSLVGKGRGSNVMAIINPVQDKDTGALAWSDTKVNIKKTGKWIRLPKFEGVVPPQYEEGLFPIVKPEH
ncbi:MAG: Anaerobic selenocysteine-containing dehydrogenase/Anaerobic selenocysteine-containing dehydrogenase [Chloroflexi bacterium]|jgi:anaerobic selenocysteine-containing dehydrogenase|nr:MAG: Anaerobic selenocysteine-containing dehydrogenase/Anaerobic selenocysteine-containing dehydrogenase [Chloroflexota bacterium]